jgi:hypothetical protein
VSPSLWVPIVVAVLFQAVLAPITWRLVWPPYKRVGKIVAFLAIASALAWFFGWWSLVFVVVHQSVGLVFHIWWCRRHDLDVWRPDPEAYVQTQKEWVASMQSRAKR